MARRSIRRTQAVVPFGVGSIVEFEDEALMPAGLDAWPAEAAEKLFDSRLARRLGNGVKYFLVPPPRPEPGSRGLGAPLPHVRFPRWHFCPRCRYLKKTGLLAETRPRCDNTHVSPRLGGKPPCGALPERKRQLMRPLRFVAVCPAGHIEDFPWSAWAHSSEGEQPPREPCHPEVLYFYATQMSGLSGLMVSCGQCGAKRSLMGSTSPGGLRSLQCSGSRPWLGENASEICKAKPASEGQPLMYALQRGASNLYFPEVRSSILIPPYSTKIRQLLEDPRIVETLESGRENGETPDFVYRAIAKLKGVDAEQLKRAYLEQREGDEDAIEDEKRFRHAEFKALQEERRAAGDALVTRPQDMARYAKIVSENITAISLVEQLAETRALIGFSRIQPGGAQLAKLSLRRLPWLPAFRVYGEGLFLAFDIGRIAGLDQSSQSRTAKLVQRGERWGRVLLPVTPGLIFLHTLAHLLIKRLSFEAGYGASSIRERIYSAPARDDEPMAGILLYTAAGDADGTLGGLVGLGRPGRFERILIGALEDARWCASDPICAESSGQGPEALNLAACHSCALLPETSCEFQNRLLDRAIVQRYFDVA